MKTVEKKQLDDLMRAALDAGKTLVAPVRDGKSSRFAAITDPAAAALDLPITKMSLKEHFLPRTECILKYERAEDGGFTVTDPEPPKELLVFGARPCDAAALAVTDKVFTWDYMDNLYLARRANSTIVTIACDAPGPACHCEDVGLSPTATAGADVILVPIGGDRYSVSALTEKGEKIMSLWSNKLADAPDAESKPAAPPATGKSDAESIRVNLKKHFDSPAWAEATMKCLGCGVCAYTCPTCHCFDIVDEDDARGGGTRRRNWDACAFSLFTKHGGGHNPRSEQWQRYRQRLMHKFDYYPEKFGVTACVGCGRCITLCPVNMDIFDILEKVSKE